MTNHLTPEENEINIWIYRLDEVARDVEARWGIDRLPGLVSPETQAKWQRQVSKLNDAIINHDLPLVRDLAQGTIRAWAALEAEAVRLGAEKNHPDVWDVRSPDTGIHYRVCKTAQDARLWACQPDVVVYSLEEISRILDQRQLTVMHPVGGPKPNPITPAKFDFAKGDDIPW